MLVLCQESVYVCMAERSEKRLMTADTGLFDDGAIVIGHAIIFVIADLKLFKNLNFHRSALDLSSPPPLLLN